MANFWLILHNLDAWKDHNDRIARNAEAAKRIRLIRKEDRIVYYCTDDYLLTGLFRVSSDMKDYDAELGSREYTMPTKGFDIEPIYVPSRPIEVTSRDLGIQPVRMMTTALQLKRDEFSKIKSLVLGMNDPDSHDALVTLFGKIHREVGFPRILRIRTRFPDALVQDHEGNEVNVEFELYSNTFEQEHDKKDWKKCDRIVCWEDDWGALAPLPVVELKKEIYGA